MLQDEASELLMLLGDVGIGGGRNIHIMMRSAIPNHVKGQRLPICSA